MIIRRRELIGEENGSFADLSWTKIKQVCDAGLAATYIANGIWNIGDVNTSVNYGSYTGGIQIVHCLTDDQRGSTYYNTNGHIVVQFVDIIATSTYMSTNSYQKYFSGTLHTACNSTIYGGLDSTFKALLESWTCYVGKENVNGGSTSGTYNQSVYLASPSIQEIGSSNNYNFTENNACFVLDYYSDSSTAQARRVKSGAATTWWLRSPSQGNYLGSWFASYSIRNDGGVDTSALVYHNLGVSPIMVI